MGLARILRAHFKKWNYPCSLVVLSKHPFFFTAPHKGPFDIFLMESAKPTFGSNTPPHPPPPPFPATHNPVKKHTSWLQTDKLSHQSCAVPHEPYKLKEEKKNLRRESLQRKENEHEFNESTLASGPLWLVQESSADLWKKCAPSSLW